MPDFGMLTSGVSTKHGTTRSPWNPEWNTGGSSSGAAAATVAGYAPINIGTDIGGSVRLPAAVHRRGRAQAELRARPGQPALLRPRRPAR